MRFVYIGNKGSLNCKKKRMSKRIERASLLIGGFLGDGDGQSPSSPVSLLSRSLFFIFFLGLGF